MNDAAEPTSGKVYIRLAAGVGAERVIVLVVAGNAVPPKISWFVVLKPTRKPAIASLHENARPWMKLQ